MSVAVSIVFTGLCALVANGDRGPAQVLLVDAKEVGESTGVALPEHTPTLIARLNGLANADTSGPNRVVAAWPGRGSAIASVPGLGFGVPEQVGIWDLAGSEVRVRAQGEDGNGVELYRPANGRSTWPEPPRDLGDPEAWRDLRFVPDMKALTGDGRIDPSLLGSGDAGPADLPRRVAARVLLDRGRLEGAVPSQKLFRDNMFEFGGGGAESALRQAVTDAVRWRLETQAGAVVIEIVPLAGGRVRRLVLPPSATPHDIFVSNLPAENGHGSAHQALGDEDAAALHFGAYYALLAHDPTNKPVPRLWLDRRAPGNIGTALCPPSRFN